MFGFVCGSIWFLILVGMQTDPAQATLKVCYWLWWWYVITSVFVFFSIFSAWDPVVAAEIRKRFLRGANFSKEAIFFGSLAALVISRPVLWFALKFLREFSENSSAFSQSWWVGAILLLFGTMLSVQAMFPMTANSIIRSGQ